MTTRLRTGLLAVGLLFAGQATAATLTVYSKMTGAGGSGAAAKVAPTATSPGATTIDCATNSPANCVDAAVAAGATIELEPTLVSNAAFVGWAGCTSVAGSVCTVSMTGAKTVTATFKPFTYALEVKTYPVPTGSFVPQYGGRLQAAVEEARNETDPAVPVAIDCKSGDATYTVCGGAVQNGAALVITAVPAALSKVTSWSGCSSSTATTCTVAAMTTPKLVSATFGPTDIPVTAQVQGPGRISSPVVAGSVTDGMACGADCTAQVVSGQNITFTATPDAGAMFIGWTGCSSATTSCTITAVTSPKAVTATFKSTNCSSCHGTPPASHGPYPATCVTCHPGFSNGSVDAAVHMDGTAQFAFTPPAGPPASFGFNLEVVGFQPFGDATYPRGYVDLRATDNAAANLDLIALINTCQTYSGVATAAPCDGSNRSTRLSIGQIQDDGSFRPVLRGSTATAVASSETIAVTRLTDQGAGVFRYQPQYGFLAAVPYDAARDYRAVAYGGRYYKAAGQPNVPYYDSDYADLQGTGTARAKETVTDTACNACHGKLTLHGMRRGVNVCLSCHNLNLPLGSGNTDAFKWDLKNLAHKLHSGKNYGAVGVNPTKPDGTVGSAWGTTMDASHMAMGPSHSTYMDGGVDSGIMGMECGVCHEGANAAFAYTKPSRFACGSCHDAVNFATGEGHDGVAGGGGIVQADDTLCALCHTEASNRLIHSPFYDAGSNENFNLLSDFPAGGHVLQVKITNVQIDASGRPTFTIDAKYKNGSGAMVAADLATWRTNVDADGAFRLTTCAFTIAGPTSDYKVPTTGSTTVGCAPGSSSTGLVEVTPGTPGIYTVGQLGTGFFAGKAGAYTVSFEIMMVRVALVTGTTYVRKPFSADPNFFTVANTGTAAAPVWLTFERGSGSADDLAYSRRAVVSYDKCNACHVDLGFHSNRGRQGPDYCAMCHNPMLDNGTRVRFKLSDTDTGALGGKVLPESVSMNVFIHRIHMGADLPSVNDPAVASPWAAFPGSIIYGSNRTATDPTPGAEGNADLTYFGMPNPMGRCDQCHISSATWRLNEGPGLAPILREYRTCVATTSVDPDGVGPLPAEDWCGANSGVDNNTARPKGAAVTTPPLKAVCTSCHDDDATDLHADMNSTSPMSQNAVELCSGCHGVGAPWDAETVHAPIP